MTQWGEITHSLKKEVLQIWKRWSMELDKYGKKWHIWNYWTHCNLARCEMIWNINRNPKKGIVTNMKRWSMDIGLQIWKEMTNGNWINMARYEENVGIWPIAARMLKLINIRLPPLVWKLFTVDDDNG